LPPQISFSTRWIGELLVPSSGKKVRPLCHQRNAVYFLLPYFTFEDDFMKFIVVKLKECYDHLLKKKPRGYIKGLSIEGTLLGAVQEVSSFDYTFSSPSHLLMTIQSKLKRLLTFFALVLESQLIVLEA